MILVTKMRCEREEDVFESGNVGTVETVRTETVGKLFMSLEAARDGMAKDFGLTHITGEDVRLETDPNLGRSSLVHDLVFQQVENDSYTQITPQDSEHQDWKDGIIRLWDTYYRFSLMVITVPDNQAELLNKEARTFGIDVA